MEVQAIREQDFQRVSRRRQGKYESLLGLVPGLKSIEVGVNRNEGKTSYDAVMLADFDSWEALAAYKADTLRDNVIQYVETIADVRAKVEYER